MDRILVGTDFSPASEAALEGAFELARTRGAAVVVCHVVETPAADSPFAAGEMSAEAQALEVKEAERKLDAIRARHGETGVETRLVRGAPAPLLCELAAGLDASLLVLGAHERSAFSRLAFGSVVDAALRHSPSPVWIVHEGDAPLSDAPRRALVSVDLEEGCPAVASRAIELVGEGGLLTLLHVVPLPAGFFRYGSGARDELPTALRDRVRDAQRQLDALAAALSVPHRGVRLDSRVATGDAVRAIVDCAEADGADFIAMDARGVSTLRALIAGSTSEAVTAEAPCPLLIERMEGGT